MTLKMMKMKKKKLSKILIIIIIVIMKKKKKNDLFLPKSNLLHLKNFQEVQAIGSIK